MDVIPIEHVVTIDDFLREHMYWLLAALPIIWGSVAGAVVRLLLIRSEPFWMRAQNGAAGILIALTLSETTAVLLTDGKYAHGYAVIYGMVGRELFVTLFNFVQDRATPFLLSTLKHFFPFAFKDEKLEDDHDND